MLNLKDEQRTWLDSFYEKLEAKIEWLAGEVSDIIPYKVDKFGNYFDKRFDIYSSGVQWWTNGFYAGMLWLHLLLNILLKAITTVQALLR